MGTAVIRLADADVLPFEFTSLAETVQKYGKRAEGSPEPEAGRRAGAKPSDRRRRVRGDSAIRGSRCRLPKVEAVPPAINFAPLDNAAAALSDSARRYERALAAARATVVADAAALRALNARLRRAELQLLDDAGLPRRSWYRHLVYAPGFYTGYGVKTVPGVREGIEQGRYDEAESEVARAARALARLTALIDAASADLEGLAKQ